MPVDVESRFSYEQNIFCFLDGRTASCDDLQRYSPDAIDRIEVLKGALAVQRFGPEADGAILVMTKPSIDPAEPVADPSESIFYFIDGRTASRADFRQLPHDTIERIEIFKNWAAVARYGSEAEAGAIHVTTKRAR
jgi:outer membrane receptor for ferrienterochelin and colicin